MPETLPDELLKQLDELDNLSAPMTAEQKEVHNKFTREYIAGLHERTEFLKSLKKKKAEKNAKYYMKFTWCGNCEKTIEPVRKAHPEKRKTHVVFACPECNKFITVGSMQDALDFIHGKHKQKNPAVTSYRV